MEGLLYLSLPGWFLLGIAYGLGPCLGHCLLIIMPYAGMARKDTRQSLSDLLSFSLARLGGHAMMGFFSGAIGGVFYRLIRHPILFPAARFVLGLLLLGLAITVLFHHDSLVCRIMHRFNTHQPGRAMFAAGLLTVLMPCPALLGLMAYSAASGRMLYGLLSGLIFAGGTLLSPLAIAVPAISYLKTHSKSKKLALFMTYLAGFVLFAYGTHLCITAIQML